LADSTFIQSRCAFYFPSPEEGTDQVSIPAQYVGPVKDWVTKTRLFNLATAGGDITFVGQQSTNDDADKSSKKSK